MANFTTTGSDTFPAGHVITYFQDSTLTETNASVSSYNGITNMNGTITPKYSGSKILIMMHCGSMIQGGHASIYAKITGTTTGTVMEQTRYGYHDDTAWHALPIAITTFDTTSNTNAQTYQLYLKSQNQPGTSNYWRVNSAESTNIKAGSVILMEIKQ